MSKKKVSGDIEELCLLIEKMDDKEFLATCELFGIQMVEIYYEDDEGNRAELEEAIKDRKYKIKHRERSYEEILMDLCMAFGELKLIRRRGILRDLREGINFYNGGKFNGVTTKN